MDIHVLSFFFLLLLADSPNGGIAVRAFGSWNKIRDRTDGGHVGFVFSGGPNRKCPRRFARQPRLVVPWLSCEKI
jgi:hypothetical protein